MKYRTLLADPPWPYSQGFADGGANHLKDGKYRATAERGPIRHKQLPYKPMTLLELRALPVNDLALSDARLFLWATSRYLPTAIDLLVAWGFEYKQTLIWDKRPNVNPLAGGVAAIAAEFLLVGARGAPGMLARWPSSIVTHRKARSMHSAKPEVFIDMVETVSPGPYVELFARRHRLGWDVWGDESANTANLAS